MSDVKRLDPASLKALAHPLRVDLFQALRDDGSSTATLLAERFGETSGATSYHLRQLARYGFVEEDPDRGTRRERWWRAAVRGTQLDVRDEGFLDDPPSRELARWYVRHQVRELAAEAERFLDTAEQWDEAWLGAASISDARLELTPAQLEALQTELREVVERHRIEIGANPAPGARRVQVTLQAYPVGGEDGR